MDLFNQCWKCGQKIENGRTVHFLACPSVRYTVTFGSSQRAFLTEYHADQFMRALTLNGTQATLRIET